MKDSLGLCFNRPVTIKKYWSGKRDSNSRPQPWQGCALPTELFPQARAHTLKQLVDYKDVSLFVKKRGFNV